MGKPRLLIFDVDGTLRDSSRALSEGLSGGFLSVGYLYPFSSKQVWNLRGVGKYNSRLKLVEALYTMNLIKKDVGEILQVHDTEEKLDYLIKHNLNDADKARIEKIFEISRNFSNSRMARYFVEVFPFAERAINLLKSRNYELALLTNSSLDTVKRDLGHIDLGSFSKILAGEDLSAGKPSGEGIRKIMSEVGVAPDETIHIGDSAVDIRAAKDAGCGSAAVLSGAGLRHHLEREKPDHIFENIMAVGKHFEAQ